MKPLDEVLYIEDALPDSRLRLVLKTRLDRIAFGQIGSHQFDTPHLPMESVSSQQEGNT